MSHAWALAIACHRCGSDYGHFTRHWHLDVENPRTKVEVTSEKWAITAGMAKNVKSQLDWPSWSCASSYMFCSPGSILSMPWSVYLLLFFSCLILSQLKQLGEWKYALVYMENSDVFTVWGSLGRICCSSLSLFFCLCIHYLWKKKGDCLVCGPDYTPFELRATRFEKLVGQNGCC